MTRAARSAKTSFIPDDGPFTTTFMGTISEGKQVLTFRKGETIYSQGSPANDIYFVQTGRVKVSVLSHTGKEAVLAICGPANFLGECCLVGQFLRTSTATALEPVTVLRIDKRAMLRVLLTEPDHLEKFLMIILKRNIDLEEDLCDQLLNHSEKRLARVLLKLARHHEGAPDVTITRLSHETLAEMVGTTRSRITHFMNKFRKTGLIEYNGHVPDRAFELIVKTERLANMVLED